MAREKLSDLAFAESRHRYTDPRTGERVTGVTTIVGHLDTGDKLGAGAAAAVRLQKEGLDHREVWGEKADTGNRVHGYAEDWAKGKSTVVDAQDEPYLDAFAAFCNDHRPEWLEAERAVVSHLGYGGRFDLIGAWGEEFWAVDLKTGKQYLPELALQLAGYTSCDGMIVYDERGMAVDLDPLPHVDRWAGLYLHDDGHYELIEVPRIKPEEGMPRDVAQKCAVEAFRHLAVVKIWATAEKRKR